MDAVPDYTIVRTFAFLSGRDVSRFQRLNKRIRDLIRTNRIYLKFPKIHLEISERKKPSVGCISRNTIYVSVNHEIHWIMYSASPEYVSLSSVDQPPLTLRNETYRPLPMDDLRSQHSLFSILNYLSEKGDIELDIDISNSELIETIITCINHIEFINAKFEDLEGKYAMLSSIENHNVVNRNRPTMHITIDEIGSMWSNLSRINQVASTCSYSRFIVHEDHLVSSLVQIAKEWRQQLFPKLYFDLYFRTLNRRLDQLTFDEYNEIEENFFFEFNNLTNRNKMSSIRFEEKVTENVLQFNFNKKKSWEDSSNQKWTDFEVTISAKLK